MKGTGSTPGLSVRVDGPFPFVLVKVGISHFLLLLRVLVSSLFPQILYEEGQEGLKSTINPNKLFLLIFCV